MSDSDPTPESDEVGGSAEVTIEGNEYDVDGDGVADVTEVITTTAIDVDGDGVVDAVRVTQAIGADLDGDGEISDDEIAVDDTVYVRDDLVDEEE